MVEGTPLLRVQAGNRLEGSNPFVSATSLQGIVLPIRAQLDFPVVFEGYVWWAVHWPDRQEGQNRSLGVDILWTSRLLGFGEEPVSN